MDQGADAQATSRIQPSTWAVVLMPKASKGPMDSNSSAARARALSVPSLAGVGVSFCRKTTPS